MYGEAAPPRADRLLDVRGLTVEYTAGVEPVRACADVSFCLDRGEILGIAGESGCGKSTLVTALTRLHRPPARISHGEIFLHHDERVTDLVTLDEPQLRALRWDTISIVLQSAMDALNPVTRLGHQFVDVLRTHQPEMSRKQADARAAELLTMVGIPPERARSYAHEMSGGTRQRATIALALACNPSLVVMDEPTTAVDVVMQRKILQQILRLRDELGFAVVFVTHDLSLLLEMADSVAIMYAGRIVEVGAAPDIYSRPRHPYTRGLRDSFPPLHEPPAHRVGIPGTPPDLRQLPAGCAFHPRCPDRFGPCDQVTPGLRPVGDQEAACLLYEPAAESSEPEEATYLGG